MKLEKKITDLKNLLADLETQEINLDLALDKYQKALGLIKEILAFLNQKEEEVLILKKEGEKIISSTIK